MVFEPIKQRILWDWPTTLEYYFHDQFENNVIIGIFENRDKNGKLFDDEKGYYMYFKLSNNQIIALQALELGYAWDVIFVDLLDEYLVFIKHLGISYA